MERTLVTSNLEWIKGINLYQNFCLIKILKSMKESYTQSFGSILFPYYMWNSRIFFLLYIFWKSRLLFFICFVIVTVVVLTVFLGFSHLNDEGFWCKTTTTTTKWNLLTEYGKMYCLLTFWPGHESSPSSKYSIKKYLRFRLI